jgi:hypothetical protein
MREIARSAPSNGAYRVYLVGGATALLAGWRASSIDADLFCEQNEVFRDIQEIKERLNINVEFVRPEEFVPALSGTEDRHVFIEAIGVVSYFHYDPYAQVFSKVVRGFRRDVEDASQFVRSGMVDPAVLRSLVDGIPESAYARYPHLSRGAVDEAIGDFVESAR